MSGQATPALKRAVLLSQQLLDAAGGSNLQDVAMLDEQRRRLLQSARAERDSLSDADRLMLREVAELNDRAIGLVEHQRRIIERAMDMAAVGRKAVTAYATNRARR